MIGKAVLGLKGGNEEAMTTRFSTVLGPVRAQPSRAGRQLC
jgi:hypothetical protein